ncbi:MAG: tetratricopeptide repeat protein, partial [Saprospiraceae bacterium]|nr:tetratricopeptide repeat protein [Saprospiraceae bacterium]
MPKLLILIFLSSLLILHKTSGQQPSQIPDSILTALNTIQQDSAKVNFLNTYVKNNYFVNPSVSLSVLDTSESISIQADSFRFNHVLQLRSISYYALSKWDSMIHYSLQTLELTDSIQEASLYGKVLSNLSSVMRLLSKDEEAHQYRLRARERYESINDTLGLAIIDNDLGLYYFDLGNYTAALDHYQKAYKGLESQGHKQGESIVLNNLGMIIHQQKDYREARAYYMRSYEVAKTINSKEQMASTLNNIGSSFQDEGLLDSAMVYHQKSLNIKEEVNDYGRMASSYNNFGIIYFKKGEYNLAIKNHMIAARFAKESLDPQTEADALIKLGIAEKQVGQYSNAKKHLESGLMMAQEVNNLQLQQEANKALHELLKNTSPKTALKYLSKAYDLQDSLLNEEKVRELTIKETSYEFEKEKIAKEQEITLLNTTNELQALRLDRSKKNILFLSGIAILLALFSYLIFLSRSKIKLLNNDLTQKKVLLEEALEQKEILLKEIHHRVKNNLQVISSLLKLQSRNVDDEITQRVLNAGQNRVMSMALIHQNLYQDGNLTGIHMPSYIKQMSKELILNYQTDEQHVELVTDVEDLKLDVDTVVPIGLIINELITNTLKYAFKDTASPIIRIILKERNDGLFLEVDDNGVGFDPSDVSNEKLGMRLVRSFAKRLKA